MTMAYSQFYLVLSISSSLFLLMMMMMNSVFAGPTGLTLKLIHIDSPESPLYPGNLTQKERIHREFQRSKAWLRKLTTKIKQPWKVRNNDIISKSSHPDDLLEPPVSFDGAYYLVSLGIGTFPNQTFKTYFFVLDTASDNVWLQCKGCDPCFPQFGELYPAQDSATYRPLPCNEEPLHPLCEPGFCEGNFCAYDVEYGDKSYTKGVLATETLALNSGMHGLESVHNFVIGCGLEQKNFLIRTRPGQAQTEIAGILGLGGEDESFLQQLGDRAQMKFAYCLQLWSDKWAASSNTYLRFGSDADHIGGVVVQTTPFFYGRGDTLYYVDLYDISIGDQPPIGYPPGAFGLTNTGTGGCVFDSGAPWTLIKPGLYDIFEAHLIQYFAALGIHTTDEHDVPREYDTCFVKPNGFNNYPSITFHFEDADFEIEPAAAFYISDHLFCSAIIRHNVDASFAVLFAAIQQANHRVLYDIDKEQISWSREECVVPL